MTKQQLSVLLSKLQEDSAFRDKLQSAADLDSLLAMSRNAGFEINSVDISNLLEKVPLGDEDLSEVSCGRSMRDYQDMLEKPCERKTSRHFRI